VFVAVQRSAIRFQVPNQNDLRISVKWCAQSGKMMCAAGKNGVRAISDGTDVLGKMMCALVGALMCAPMAEVPVAQRISFSFTIRTFLRRSVRSVLAVTWRFPV